MNTDTMLARLNELDAQLCSAVGISRSGDATTVDEAIAMSAATTDRLLTGERGIRDVDLIKMDINSASNASYANTT